MAQGSKHKPIRERLAHVFTTGRDKGRLTFDELNNLLPDDVASPEEIDELLTLLGKENIEIVDKPSATGRLGEREEKEAKEEEAAELAEVGQLDDPVKMYLRQMGQIPLVSREEEIRLAKDLTVSELLAEQNVKMPEMVSVELNGRILKRSEFENTTLNEGDKVEFLYFMGGGNVIN